MRKFIVIGNGNIGSTFVNDNFNEVIFHIQRTRNLENVLEELVLFLQKKTSEQITVINVVGIIDVSKCTTEEINSVNIEFPLKLVKMSEKMNFQIVTLGSIMENFPKYCLKNIYLKSKLNFLEEIIKNPSQQHLHIQLHTLYGGKKMHKNMFLSNLFYSLKYRTKFEMSSGQQLREYHHVSDESSAIIEAVNHFENGIVDISSGSPIRLKDLVVKIANSLDLSQLILIDNVKVDKDDNFLYTFTKSKFLADTHFRDSVNGILDLYHTNYWYIK